MVVAVLLAVSGGFRFTVGGLRVSAHSPLTPSLAAIAMVAGWAWLAARRGLAAHDLTAIESSIDRAGWPIVIGVAAASAGMAIAFGTFSAAGADASGYLSQAAMWAAGRLELSDPLPLLPGWPPDAGISAPLGWNAAAERGWQVPTYGPGLPLLMAMPLAAGGSLIASVTVAVSAAIAVAASGAIAFRMAGWPAAIVAAVTLATCPVFIFQAVQPMSDVPVTAAWMVAWWLVLASPRTWLAGLACAIAVLIRPNLAPLALAPFLYLLFVSRRAPRPFGTPGTPGTLGTLATFVLPVVSGGIFLAWLQWQWYGSPFRSGYGTVEQLYSFTNVGLNASRYATWLVSTCPILLLAVVGFWIRRGPAAWALVAFAVLNAAAYLVYFVFDEWSYLRFLLPGLAIATVLTGVAIAALVGRLAPPARAGVLFAVVLVIGSVGLSRARALDAFQLAGAYRRILQIDRYLEAALPDRAVVVAGEQSGAARFDTGRSIVRWEAASRDDLMQMLKVLEADRRPVWLLLDAWEESLVRAKFTGLDFAALDWPPAVDAGETHRTRAWRLSDRERYLKGERVVTDRLR
jgi:hypothetical protein